MPSAARALSVSEKHPQYALAREQMHGGGGMVSFEVEAAARTLGD